MRHMAGNGMLRAVRLMHLVDVAEAACHGGDVDGRVAAADHHHALADMAQASVVERLEE